MKWFGQIMAHYGNDNGTVNKMVDIITGIGMMGWCPQTNTTHAERQLKNSEQNQQPTSDAAKYTAMNPDIVKRIKTAVQNNVIRSVDDAPIIWQGILTRMISVGIIGKRKSGLYIADNFKNGQR